MLECQKLWKVCLQKEYGTTNRLGWFTSPGLVYTSFALVNYEELFVTGFFVVAVYPGIWKYLKRQRNYF
jgi:hypothetical protein